MNIDFYSDGRVIKVSVNSYKPVVKFNFNGKPVKLKELKVRNEALSIKEDGCSIVIEKDLDIKEHIIGLGEKAFNIDRRRTALVMWNTDAFSYGYGTDPMYVSVPFFISIRDGKPFGIFINSTSKVKFDFGVKRYDKMTISVPENAVEIYLFNGKTVEEIVEEFTDLTGKPFEMPGWALGHLISRYGYFSSDKIIDVVDEYRKYVPVEAIFLDIDHMDNAKDFTWNKSFGDPKKMISELHKRNVKVITIVDPAIPIDQNYEVFKQGIGKFCMDSNGNMYVGKLWGGNSAFPDFLNKTTRRWWTSLIKKWADDYKIDGIWLDMNEPTDFNFVYDPLMQRIENALGIAESKASDLIDYERKSMDLNALHIDDDNEIIKHSMAHNAYALFEAESTKDAGVEFILSRSGFAGIQSYAAIWSGDNHSSYEDLKLQIPLLTSLSISGVAYVGCDIGGFAGHSDPELISKYYKMALFLPLFRNHKNKFDNEQEIYSLPDRYRKEIIDTIKLRYEFLPYLHKLAKEAHEKGHPIIRPLCYEFFLDENTFSINDEYMVGSELLYAPQIDKNGSREIYLPNGKWYDWWSGKEIDGRRWIRSDDEFPIFVRDVKKMKDILKEK